MCTGVFAHITNRQNVLLQSLWAGSNVSGCSLPHGVGCCRLLRHVIDRCFSICRCASISAAPPWPPHSSSLARTAHPSSQGSRLCLQLCTPAPATIGSAAKRQLEMSETPAASPSRPLSRLLLLLPVLVTVVAPLIRALAPSAAAAVVAWDFQK